MKSCAGQNSSCLLWVRTSWLAQRDRTTGTHTHTHTHTHTGTQAHTHNPTLMHYSNYRTHIHTHTQSHTHTHKDIYLRTQSTDECIDSYRCMRKWAGVSRGRVS